MSGSRQWRREGGERGYPIGMESFYIAMTAGSWILIGVMLVMVFAVGTGLYTRGSRARIPETPYGGRRGTRAPGAEGSGDASGHDSESGAAGASR